jgi:hypothetical protein
MVVTVETLLGAEVPVLHRDDVLVYEGYDRDKVTDWVPLEGDHEGGSSALIKPTGDATMSSPRWALARRASTERWRSKSSSYSFKLPFKPNNKRSLLCRGVYTVSWSINKVSTNPTHFNQLLPLSAVACESRYFARRERRAA